MILYTHPVLYMGSIVFLLDLICDVGVVPAMLNGGVKQLKFNLSGLWYHQDTKSDHEKYSFEPKDAHLYGTNLNKTKSWPLFVFFFLTFNCCHY